MKSVILNGLQVVTCACFVQIGLCLNSPLLLGAEVDFNRDVRSILSNHCFQCHGADAESREADLRLDQRESALEVGAIHPTLPEESSLLQRIRSNDADEIMPPAEANKPLTAKQINILEQWIQQGAEYGEHWAFTPVEKIEPPVASQDPWCKNEIDRFIRHKLNEQGLSPAPQASRHVLIRRLYQDLLGLLPEIEDVEAFVNDTSPEAYEKLVDRVLASPHYGERWGRHWLDQARYADSNGYTIDGPRIMWPYRDWVIAAINADMPFDQFTMEQLAGDLLPNPTKQQLVATAFHRNTMINQEGGVKADQYRNEALVDRVNTTGAVWLGLTLGCAQCHSHKFDPITQNEYYSLYAFFNDASDSNNVGPTVDVYEEEMFGWPNERFQQLAELNKLKKEVVRLEEELKDKTGLSNVKWEWEKVIPTEYKTASGAEFELLEDGSLLGNQSFANNETYTVRYQIPVTDAEEQQLTALRLRLIPDPSLPKNGPGLAGNGNIVLTNVSLAVDGQTVPWSRGWADHSQPDYAIAGAIDDDPATGWAINVDGKQAKAGKKMNAPHEAVFALRTPTEFAGKQLTITMEHSRNAKYLVGRFAFDLTTTLVPEQSSFENKKQRLTAVKVRLKELETIVPGKGIAAKQMVIRKQEKTPETYRLIRGDFLDPDQESGSLALTVPASLVLTDEMPTFESRMDLAKWLVSRENPLTSRVTVNRIWSKYFGRGLVETENDFGFQGTLPSHPKLLDWLAATFMEQEWSLKKLHRLIVTSATYQQASDVSDMAAQKDPKNYYLSHQARFRVEAEIVRDQALAASGLLTPKLGGPSVFPPQPDGVYNFTQNKKSWPTETGENRYRRTMYTMFYRSAPYPLLTTFDSPDFSTACTRRVRSNTPLQSLTMANDLVFQELAAGLAKRVFKNEQIPSVPEQIQRMFQLALTRQPTQVELDIMTEFHQRELERFQTNSEKATEFVESTLEGTDRVQLAALASVARVLFNTDEFVTRN